MTEEAKSPNLKIWEIMNSTIQKWLHKTTQVFNNAKLLECNELSKIKEVTEQSSTITTENEDESSSLCLLDQQYLQPTQTKLTQNTFANAENLETLKIQIQIFMHLHKMK